MGPSAFSSQDATAAALARVHDSAAAIMRARRKDDLVAARKKRDKAIIKAVELMSVRDIATAAGISLTRVTQICQKHPRGPSADPSQHRD